MGAQAGWWEGEGWTWMAPPAGPVPAVLVGGRGSGAVGLYGFSFLPCACLNSNVLENGA